MAAHGEVVNENYEVSEATWIALLWKLFLYGQFLSPGTYLPIKQTWVVDLKSHLKAKVQ